MQSGDFLVALQGQTVLGLSTEQIINRFLTLEDTKGCNQLAVVTQYTVAENVIPSSGVFDVRLVKSSGSLGINLQSSLKCKPGEPLLISKVIPGSVASRNGCIGPGDILLAVNGTFLDACKISDAVRLLQSFDDIVTLRVKKQEYKFASDQTNPSREMPYSPEHNKWTEGNMHRCSSDNDFSADNRRQFSNFEQIGQEANFDQPVNHTSLPQSKNHSENQQHRKQRVPQRETKSNSKYFKESSSSSPPVILSETISSDFFSDAFHSDSPMTIHCVRLTRPNLSCPWGIVISGTDEFTDSTVVIDSLTPNKPGENSGLLRKGDQIISVNDARISRKLKFSQVMAQLQQPSLEVVLFIGRSIRDNSQNPSAANLSSNSEIQINTKAQMDHSWSTPTHPQDPLHGLRPQQSSKGQVQRQPSMKMYDFRRQKSFDAKDSREKTVDLQNRPRTDKCKFQHTDSTGSWLSYNNLQIPEQISRYKKSTHREVDDLNDYDNRQRSQMKYERTYRREKIKHESSHNSPQMDDFQKAADTLDFDEIQCPGCRKAVVDEVLFQQRLNSPNEDEAQRKMARSRKHRDFVNSRGRSLEYSQTDEVFNNSPPPISHRLPKHDEGKHLPQETRNMKYRTNLPLIQARSDSRLDREFEMAASEFPSFSPTLGSEDGRHALSNMPSSSHGMSRKEKCANCEFDRRNVQDSSKISRSSQTDLWIKDESLKSASRRVKARSVSRERDWRGWIRLVKPTPNDSYGIGLSDGLSARGIYVSAIRSNSVADVSGLLRIYDRIIKVNDVSVRNRTCREVVNLIRRSTNVLDLLIHRRR